jgi:hypothetical protein
MRATLPLGVLLAASATLVEAPSASAQFPPDAKFIQVDYMKVVEGKYPEYQKLEQIWKTLHQERVQKGQIESWSLYVVALPPYSTSREYDAVTVTVLGRFAKMESPYDEAQIKKMDSFPRAEDSRKLVRSEVWTVYRTAGPELFASKFATVLFHKARPGQLGDYLRAQTEHYAPINEELVKSGVRKAWHSLGIVYPSGAGREYDWVTFDGFDRFDAPAGDTTAGIDPQRVAAAGKAVSAHRDIVQNEYWRLIDRTSSK